MKKKKKLQYGVALFSVTEVQALINQIRNLEIDNLRLRIAQDLLVGKNDEHSVSTKWSK